MKTRKLWLVTICVLVVAVGLFVVLRKNNSGTNNLVAANTGQVEESAAETTEPVSDQLKTDNSGTAEPVTEMEMHVSWAYAYPDIKSLTESSDFIGLIEIVDVIDVFETGVEASPIYFTRYSAKVLGGVLSDSDMMEVVMTGKKDDKGIIEISDDPLMSAGEIWFIFAGKNDDGSYTILGGPTGRFSYNKDNGTITSLNRFVYPEVGQRPEINISLLDASLSEVEAEIKLYLSK